MGSKHSTAHTKHRGPGQARGADAAVEHLLVHRCVCAAPHPMTSPAGLQPCIPPSVPLSSVTHNTPRSLIIYSGTT